MTIHRVLVVEDDHGLRGVLARGLREEHFEVLTAADGAGALRTVDDQIDAVVVDIGLPDSDGRDVCQAVRAAGLDMPVIFLTARDGLTSRLSGFSAGGDDYLAKPFHLAELAARVRAVLRRAGREAATEVDGLRLDPVVHVLKTADGTQMPLTPTEFRLLASLMADPGAVVRRNALVRSAWPEGAQVNDNTLDQYLRRLRRKLREAGVSGASVPFAASATDSHEGPRAGDSARPPRSGRAGRDGELAHAARRGLQPGASRTAA